MSFKIIKSFLFSMFFILLLIIICSCSKHICCIENGEVIKRQIIGNDGSWSLNLPYEISDDIEYVFHKHTPLAIDFIEIFVDGKSFPFCTDFSKRAGVYDATLRYRLSEAEEENNEYYISMNWRRIGLEGIYWEDYTLGLSPHSRALYIPRKSKKLHITYRIILPYETLTPQNLFDKDYKDKKYTEELKICVNLEDFFKSDTFNRPRRGN